MAKKSSPVSKKKPLRSSKRSVVKRIAPGGGRKKAVTGPPSREDWLWHVAAARAARHGFRFAQNCEQDFRALLSRSLPSVRESDADTLEQVERNTALLVEEMVAVARANNWPELYEDTLRNALKKLCPLFPFC